MNPTHTKEQTGGQYSLEASRMSTPENSLYATSSSKVRFVTTKFASPPSPVLSCYYSRKLTQSTSILILGVLRPLQHLPAQTGQTKVR